MIRGNGARIGWIPSAPDPRIASARLRCRLPCRYLRETGWKTAVVDDVDRAESFDIVVFQKVYDERMIALARSLRERGTVVVFDLCDDHLYNPDGLPELEERAARLRTMLDLADAVSVSTPTLAQLVRERNPVVIDDALDEFSPPLAVQVLAAVRRRRGRGPLRLAWYGNAGLESPPFGLIHLPKLVPHLERLHRRHRLRLTVFSNSRAAYERALAGAAIPHSYVEWTPRTFVRQFPRHDVCIVPIEPNPFTLAKTGNRVALSLRLGVPVIADPIPSFEEFAPFILLDAWEESLERYASDAKLRRAHARAGQRYVDSKYTKERVQTQWGRFFEMLLAAASPKADQGMRTVG